ncbi:MAG: hypothetical protein M3P30_01230 [Chloroflexota bacterium]|nr:hypothetical protein [Chloroflexota bacterium]
MRTILILIAAAALLSACSGGSAKQPAQSTAAISATATPADAGTAQPSESAGDALKRQLGYQSKGQYGPEWDELHPAQQAIVDRTRFGECFQAAGGASLEYGNITIVETYADALSLQTVPDKTSTAVTFRYTQNGKTVTDTRHEILVDGKWRWFLTDAPALAMKAGHCP